MDLEQCKGRCKKSTMIKFQILGFCDNSFCKKTDVHLNSLESLYCATFGNFGKNFEISMAKIGIGQVLGNFFATPFKLYNI